MSTHIDTDLEAANTPYTVAAIFDTQDRSIAAVSALSREVIAEDHITIVAPAATDSAANLVATLRNQGVLERDAQSYARRVGAGGYLLTVNADTTEQANEARRLLIASGGEIVDSYQRSV